MNKIIKLARALYKINLIKEASDALKLSPAEHPDWQLWSQEEEKKMLAEVPTESRHHILTGAMKKKLNDFGITILESISSGSLGTVFSGIYNGMPVVVKITKGSGGTFSIFNNDVENWNKISEYIKSAPDYVKVLFPNIFFAHKGTISDEDGSNIPFQILVIEHLYKAPKIISDTFRGAIDPETKLKVRGEPSYMAEEYISKEYPKIKMEADRLGLSFPVERSVMEYSTSKDFSRGRLTLKEYLMDFIPEEDAEGLTDMDDEYSEKYDRLMELIYFMCYHISRDLGAPIPSNGGSMISNNEKEWQPYGGLQNFWKGIAKLRDDGIPVSDLHEGNIMMDRSGSLKVADLGGLYTVVS